MKYFKLLSGLFFLTALFLLPISFQSCTHDDELEVDIDPPNFTYGDDIVSILDGWTFDQNHSSVRWETIYLGSGALLTGRFNDFEIDLEFDEDNPENTSVFARVILSTVNTGEPNRDEGCLLNTFDVQTRDEATFSSHSVEFDNQGSYLVNGTLDFHGVQDGVDMKLNYSGTTYFDENSGVGGAPLYLAGFTAEFQMNAKTIFGIESGNISDLVVVKVNAQFKKPA